MKKLLFTGLLLAGMNCFSSDDDAKTQTFLPICKQCEQSDFKILACFYQLGYFIDVAGQQGELSNFVGTRLFGNNWQGQLDAALSLYKSEKSLDSIKGKGKKSDYYTRSTSRMLIQSMLIQQAESENNSAIKKLLEAHRVIEDFA